MEVVGKASEFRLVTTMSSNGRSLSPANLHRVGGINHNYYLSRSNESTPTNTGHSKGSKAVIKTPNRHGASSKQLKTLTESDIELILAKSIKSNRLDLSYHNLSSTELIHFVNDGLLRYVHQWNLVEINFASCQITTQGLDLLIPVLSSIRSLEIVILRNNHLNKDCGFGLSKLLVNVGKLKLLDISGNHLGDIGITGFAAAFNEVITSHTEDLSLFSLQFLDLSNNDFSDPGVLSLCRGLLQFVRRSQGIGRNVALKILKLNSSKMSDKGVQCLTQLINSSKPIPTNANTASKVFQLEEVSLENSSEVTARGLAMLFGDPKNSSYSPLKKLNLSLNKSLNIDLLRHLSFCIQYGSCRLEVVHLEFSQDCAKECIRHSAKIYGGLISTDEYSLSEAFRELVDTLLNINHTRDIVLKRIFLGSLPKAIFELCVEGMDKSDVNLYNDCIKALEYMNPAADIFQIPYITNISSWVRSKMYSNMLYITTPMPGVSTNQLVASKPGTPNSRGNNQTLSKEFQSQSLQQQFISEKEKIINESMIYGRRTQLQTTPGRAPLVHTTTMEESLGTLSMSDLYHKNSSYRSAISDTDQFSHTANSNFDRHQLNGFDRNGPCSPLFIPGMDISSAFPQAAEYMKSKFLQSNSVLSADSTNQQLVSEKYLSAPHHSIEGFKEKPTFSSDKSLDFTIIELREQEILRTRKDHASALTALSKEINKLVEDSPTKVFDKLDKLKAELAESKKIETEVRKLQEIIPKSVLDMEDEDDDVSEEVKQALAELNRKMNKDTTVESQKSGAIKRPEIAKQQTPLKASRKADSEPGVEPDDVGNTTLMLQDPPEFMRISSPIQLPSSEMGPLSPRSRSTSPNSIRIAHAMIHNSVDGSINNLHHQYQNRTQSPLRLFSPSRSLSIVPPKSNETIAQPHPPPLPLPLSMDSQIVPPLPEKKIDQLFDLMSKIFGEVQQIEKKQSEIEVTMNKSINQFDERIHSLESSTSIALKDQIKAWDGVTKVPSKDNVKDILADRLVSGLHGNTLSGIMGELEKSKMVGLQMNSSNSSEASTRPTANIDLFEQLLSDHMRRNDGAEDNAATLNVISTGGDSHTMSPNSTVKSQERSIKDDDTDNSSIASLYSLPRFSSYDPNFNSKYEEDKQYFQELQSNIAYLSNNTPTSPLANHFNQIGASRGFEKVDDDMSQSDVSMLSSTTRSTTPAKILSRTRGTRYDEKKLPHLPITSLPHSSSTASISVRKSNDQGKSSISPSIRSSRSSHTDREAAPLNQAYQPPSFPQTTPKNDSSSKINHLNHPKNGYMLPTASAYHKRTTPVSKRK